MNKIDHIQRMMEMQKKLQQAKTLQESVEVKEETPNKIEVMEVEENQDTNLPSKYLSLNQVKVSTKELSNTTSYMDKLRNINDNYETIQMNEEQAKKVKRELLRLTSGVAAVVPLNCKGSQCAFAKTCVTGDTVVLGKKDKKIKDIEINDVIYSFNTTTKRIEKDVVTDKRLVGIKKVFEITTWYGNKIKLTADHEVLTINKNLSKFKWKTIEDGLAKNDKILISDLDDIDDDLESVGDVFVDKILSIKELKETEVYDISVKKNQNFFGNNIVVHNCSFYQSGVKDLVGKPCPTEAHLMDYWLEKYKTEFNVDDKSITDLHAIGRLCTFDIYEMRLTRYLSENDQTLLVDFISSYDEEGRPISNKSTSAAWDTIDKINRMRSKELKELMATREARSKLVQTVSEVNKNNSISALKDKLEKLIKESQSKTVEGEAKEVK